MRPVHAAFKWRARERAALHFAGSDSSPVRERIRSNVPLHYNAYRYGLLRVDEVWRSNGDENDARQVRLQRLNATTMRTKMRRCKAG